MARKKHKPPALVLVPKNTIATNPLLKKGGAHGKTRKAERRAAKISLRRMSFEPIACGRAIGSNDIHVYPSAA